MTVGPIINKFIQTNTHKIEINCLINSMASILFIYTSKLIFLPFRTAITFFSNVSSFPFISISTCNSYLKFTVDLWFNKNKHFYNLLIFFKQLYTIASIITKREFSVGFGYSVRVYFSLIYSKLLIYCYVICLSSMCL